MSGGQHNPNGRQAHGQAQLGSAWNHLQVPYLGRMPLAAHMSSERAAGVTWHTPTPPLAHPYHAQAPASPDPLQALKVGGAGGNSVFRHTPTPPEREALLYRHTPTPPDKLYRHTPSPGDGKAGAALPPAEIYPIPMQSRDKMREELLAYARGGVDLTLSRPANGAPLSLSVRDAPTINNLLSARARPAHARVDALLERLAPQPHSPHSVIVHPRAAPSPSPPDSNEDSADSCGAPPGPKRKHKPDRTISVSASPVQTIKHTSTPPQHVKLLPRAEPLQPTELAVSSRLVSPVEAHGESGARPKPMENGDTPHSPDALNGPRLPHTRRKTKSDSAETIDDIAAMIASTDQANCRVDTTPVKENLPEEAPATIEVLKSVLGSPEASHETPPTATAPLSTAATIQNLDDTKTEKKVTKVPKRRSTRSSRSDVSATLESASPKTSTSPKPVKSPKPATSPHQIQSNPASEEKSEEKVSENKDVAIVDVENQLEQMFAGIEELTPSTSADNVVPNKKRRRSRTNRKRVTGKVSRRSSAALSTDEASAPKTKAARKKLSGSRGKKADSSLIKDAYDSGSNASSSRSRGPYVQIRGPRDSPLSVSVVNATTGEDDCEATARVRPPRRKGSAEGEFRNGLKSRGLHCSTLSMRYDATTPDASWVCAFCELGPHASVKERLEGPARPLGDLFGPYTISTACEEYRMLDESRRKWHPSGAEDKETREVWFHEDCGLWAPGLVAAGARLSGLQEAVWGARGARCGRCGRAGACVSCAARACPARAHVNCARTTAWRLLEDEFRALCPRHAQA